jgi:amidase
MRVSPFRFSPVYVLLCLLPGATMAQPPRQTVTALQAGSWLVAFPAGADTNVSRFRLDFGADGAIGGANPDGLSLRGQVRGDSVLFEVLGRKDGARVQFSGVRANGAIRGFRAQTGPGNAAPAPTEFVATPDRPARPAHLVSFSPSAFHRTFSSAAPPALRIISGDTVRTWTLDNAGADSTGTSRSRGGNPLTGPFYIEGALPGDMIAVRLHTIRLNRGYGRSGTEIVESALTGDDYRRLVELPGFNPRWRLDRARGIAAPEQQTPALAAFNVPLRPMLGCIGVAPFGGQSFFATESGPFGGNLDYNEIREGVTVYFPVFQKGALLFIGDGHAVQGDGELTGDAVETSMDVEFSVEVFPATGTFRGRISAPRAENQEFLMAIGISGDLQGALRMATGDLAGWLETDYGLNPSELAFVLGTRMRYDVADVVGNQLSVVAKLSKEVLRQLKPAGER